MLSYRHAFHAGNHADVLKHFVEVMLLDYLTQKDKAYWYIDTHAGAGRYALDSEYASKNSEFGNGIARLWQAENLPTALQQYLGVIRQFNPDGGLNFYPGSPAIARCFMRKQDKLRLFELHPSDYEILQQNFAALHPDVLSQKADGFAALKALLPPPPRRALVLIDPPYEEKQDYQRVVSVLKEGLKRFANGVYAVWYPALQRSESVQLPAQLKALPIDNWLHVALYVNAPRDDGFGMHGSGMFVINPPWKLHDILQEVLPVLVTHLGCDAEADFVLEQRAS